MRMDSAGLSGYFHSILTQLTIHPSSVNHGPHESEAMQKLMERLDVNGVEKHDDRSWVALVVLSAKPHNENVPWNEYQWRLCV